VSQRDHDSPTRRLAESVKSDLDKEAARSSSRYDLLMKLAFPILLGVSGWAGMSIMDHESRIDVLEASRYTPAQARQDAKEARSERDALRVQVSALQANSAASQATAAESVKRMDRIEQKLDRVLEELRRK
jgi:hypothetical protein